VWPAVGPLLRPAVQTLPALSVKTPPQPAATNPQPDEQATNEAPIGVATPLPALLPMPMALPGGSQQGPPQAPPSVRAITARPRSPPEKPAATAAQTVPAVSLPDNNLAVALVAPQAQPMPPPPPVTGAGGNGNAVEAKSAPLDAAPRGTQAAGPTAPAADLPVVAAPGNAAPTEAASPPSIASSITVAPVEAFAVTMQSSAIQAPPEHASSTAPVAVSASVAADPPSPAAQVAPALLSLARAPDGAPRMTLTLRPPELGQVEIRIDRPADAPARVEINVQRPDTLTLLLHDQPQLQRALDQAGVPAEGRSLTLQIASPPATAGHGLNAGAGGAGGGADQGGSGRGTAQAQPRDASGDDEPLSDAVQPPPRWLRAGLDITA
jgi:flagellar hook-length control protein FliK